MAIGAGTAHKQVAVYVVLYLYMCLENSEIVSGGVLTKEMNVLLCRLLASIRDEHDEYITNIYIL